MKYQLKKFNRNIPDQELLDDIKRVAGKLGSPRLSSREYDDNGGKFTSGTIGIRFGGWNNAIKRAGLKLVLKHNPSEIELFKNIEDVWIKLGRQPVLRDFKKPLSQFSPQPYRSKFGTFRNALEAFIEFTNSHSQQVIKNQPEEDKLATTIQHDFIKHKTKRYPSERLKVQVLMRDGNKCRLCGVTVTGESIHFDHIKPWSKGGETILKNIQVLCSKHNLAKGNLDYNWEE